MTPYDRDRLNNDLAAAGFPAHKRQWMMMWFVVAEHAPAWIAPYVVGIALMRWPRKVK